jgi:hypothetical protein
MGTISPTRIRKLADIVDRLPLLPIIIDAKPPQVEALGPRIEIEWEERDLLMTPEQEAALLRLLKRDLDEWENPPTSGPGGIGPRRQE